MNSTVCPCQVAPNIQSSSAPITYKDCCQPLHKGERCADNAETLMRSRYSAFVLTRTNIELADYIVATTLPAQQVLLDKSAIEAWAKDTDWAGLEVIKHAPTLGKRHAQVEFKAYYNSDDGRQAHHELSAFVKVQDASKDGQVKWYFIDPTVAMTVTQKQPCICGSGDKFKQCCGRYV